MPRRDISFMPGCYYHIYNRGNNRQIIFYEDDNYLYFLKNVKKHLRPLVIVIAYCLMPTHYHLLVQILDTQETVKHARFADTSAYFSNAMQKLSISYTKAINKRFDRVGALFQGAFQSRLVQKHNHLKNLCIYMHANPVKDGLVASPGDWLFSNYLEWIGERNGSLVDRSFIREHFDTVESYQFLVKEFIKTRYLPEDVLIFLQSLEGR